MMRESLLWMLALGMLALTCFSAQAQAEVTPGTLQWSFKTAQGIASCPAIGSDGTIYLAAGSGAEGDLYAINPDGTKKWNFAMPAGVASPAIGPDGTIYVGGHSDPYTSVCTLHAINPDGTKKWNFDQVVGFGHFTTPTIGKDGTIYFGVSGGWGGYGEGYIYALNSNGTINWVFQAGGAITSEPVIGQDGTIYFGSLDWRFSALTPNGTLKWSIPLAYRPINSPAIGTDGTIYFLGDGGQWAIFHTLYAISPEGNELWSTDILSSYSSPVIGSDGTIYVGGMGPDYSSGRLYAIDPNNAKINWYFNTDSTSYASMHTPVIGKDGTIYVGSDDTHIYAINPDGTKKWDFVPPGDLRGTQYGPATLASDGTIYIGSNYQTLYAISSSSGGIAESPWPMFHGNVKLTGAAVGQAMPPEAPTGVNATAGNAQATVTFSSPTSNGGSAITSYTVSSSPGGFKATATASPITVTGLTNGTAYIFTVKATNACGTGPESSPSNSVTPAAVKPVPDIKANGSDGPITLSSTTPLSITVSLDPGDYTGYTAEWWIAADTPMGWYSYVYPTGWKPGINLCIQKPLFDLPPLEVLNRTLPPGDYTFYYVLDGQLDGQLDITHLDSVQAHVQ